MSVNNYYDFTKGSIGKKMILFSLPIFFSNVLQASYQFIDSLWVGNLLGAEALGAISVSSTVIFAILSFIIGINMATLTVLSQLRGKGDPDGLKQSLNAFVVVLGVLTIILGIIGYLSSASILRMLGTPAEVMPMAVAYLQINFTGIVFLFGYNFIGTVLRALGDSKTPVRFVMLAVILNAILDPIMISWFNLGIEGAAYATVLAQGAAFVYGLIYSIWKAAAPFTLPHFPKRIYVNMVLKLGLPGGLQMIAVSSGIVFIMGIVASFGTVVLAGFGAGLRIDEFILLPILTLGSAVSSMAGQNIGANQWDRVKDIAIKASILVVMLSLPMGAIIFIGAEFFMKWFVNDHDTIQYGASYLRAIAFFYPFLGISFVLNGIMRSSGAMMQVLVLNLISFWVLRYPLTLFFSSWLGASGIAYGIGASFVVSSLISASYYLFGNWHKVQIFKDEDDVRQKLENA